MWSGNNLVNRNLFANLTYWFFLFRFNFNYRHVVYSPIFYPLSPLPNVLSLQMSPHTVHVREFSLKIFPSISPLTLIIFAINATALILFFVMVAPGMYFYIGFIQTHYNWYITEHGNTCSYNSTSIDDMLQWLVYHLGIVENIVRFSLVCNCIPKDCVYWALINRIYELNFCNLQSVISNRFCLLFLANTLRVQGVIFHKGKLVQTYCFTTKPHWNYYYYKLIRLISCWYSAEMGCWSAYCSSSWIVWHAIHCVTQQGEHCHDYLISLEL